MDLLNDIMAQLTKDKIDDSIGVKVIRKRKKVDYPYIILKDKDIAKLLIPYLVDETKTLPNQEISLEKSSIASFIAFKNLISDLEKRCLETGVGYLIKFVDKYIHIEYYPPRQVRIPQKGTTKMTGARVGTRYIGKRKEALK